MNEYDIELPQKGKFYTVKAGTLHTALYRVALAIERDIGKSKAELLGLTLRVADIRKVTK